jgi:hypothetical protein
MSKQTIVTINGKSYDSVSGLPVDGLTPTNAPASPKATVHAQSLHAKQQRSQTLNRKAIKKPVFAKPLAMVRNPGRTMDIARSASVAKFAPHPHVVALPVPPIEADIAPTAHPTMTKVLMKQTAHELSIQKTAPTSQDRKKAAIANALSQPSTPAVTKKPPMRRRNRNLTIAGVIVVAVLLISYILYLNMPILSVQVASLQAGITASYPDYIPDGYSLSGPVSYDNGQVTMQFNASTGSTKFTIKQAKSPWDSSAVLDNAVKPKVGNDYLTTDQNGLTIYTYNDSAAWVNGGILYTIDGNAPLSPNQIGHIATSMQ